MNTARMSWWSPVVAKPDSVSKAADSSPERGRETVRLQALAAGSREAFSAIYREYGRHVFCVARKYTASRELAEEIAQETFLFLLREPDKYDPARGELGAYLAGVARQLARRALDRVGRTLSIDSEEEQVPDDAVVSALHGIIEHQQWRHLHEAVASLPEPYREIVVMHHLEELSYEEIAEALACPLGTVRSRLSRGRDLLARKLAGWRSGRPLAEEQSNPQPGKGGTRHGPER